VRGHIFNLTRFQAKSCIQYKGNQDQNDTDAIDKHGVNTKWSFKYYLVLILIGLIIEVSNKYKIGPTAIVLLLVEVKCQFTLRSMHVCYDNF